MTYNELYEMIKQKFDLVNRPSNQELQEIYDKIYTLSKKKVSIDDGDLLEIINETVSDPTMHFYGSVNMTSSISIVKQILDKMKNK